MRRTLALTAALVAVSMACGDVTGPLGPLDFGIIQGREQAAVAGDAQLDTAVVARVWRDASGQAFIGVRPLYAQTTVTGVVGAIVCVGEVPIEGEPIIPHSRCTSTNVNGTATFHLTPPTKAGTHRTPIVAELDGVALTPDTVTAIVEPAEMATWHLQHNGSGLSTHATAGDTIGLGPLVWSAADAHGNAIPVEDVRAMPDSVIAFTWFDQGSTASTVIATGTGWDAVMPGPDGFVLRNDGKYMAGLTFTISGIDGGSNKAIFTVSP